MNKTLTLLFALGTYLYTTAQITINGNIPSSIPAGTSVTADVKINKGNIGNFAKYQMDVPPGYTVSGLDVKSGNFTFENQRAKIVWVSVPGDQEFTIQLKIQADATASNQGTIVQKFFYLENSEKKEVEGNTVTLGGGGSMASNTTPVTSSSSSSSESTSSSTGSTPVETVKSTPVETVKSTPVETVKTTPVETVKSTPVESGSTSRVSTTSSSSSAGSAVVEGVTYKVQIGAYSTQPSKSKFSGAGTVSIDMIDGLYKVTTGNFKTRDEAVKYRDALKDKGFNNGFIVTFKNGQRVK